MKELHAGRDQNNNPDNHRRDEKYSPERRDVGLLVARHGRNLALRQMMAIAPLEKTMRLESMRAPKNPKMMAVAAAVIMVSSGLVPA